MSESSVDLISGLNIRDLHFSYGEKEILRGVNLQVQTGELVAIMGSSGSGKSTLFRLIAGFEMPDAGEITLMGVDLAGIPAHKRDVVLMFQDKQLFENMSVLENVAFPLKIRGIDSKTRKKMAIELLDSMHLVEHAEKRIDEISGGQQQRVALVRSIAASPKLLLLDEPFASLDDSLRKEVAKDIREVLKTKNITTLMVTHSKEDAALVADETYVLRDGLLLK